MHIVAHLDGTRAMAASLFPTAVILGCPSRGCCAMTDCLPLRAAAAALMLLAVGVFPARAQSLDFSAIDIQTVRVADGLYVLMGGPAQGNIAVSVGSDGILLVDSMYAPMHQKILAALGRISDRPIRYVVNTHLHGDHTAGNEALARLGAVIISHENMRRQMVRQAGAPMPPGA